MRRRTCRRRRCVSCSSAGGAAHNAAAGPGRTGRAWDEQRAGRKWQFHQSQCTQRRRRHLRRPHLSGRPGKHRSRLLSRGSTKCRTWCCISSRLSSATLPLSQQLILLEQSQANLKQLHDSIDARIHADPALSLAARCHSSDRTRLDLDLLRAMAPRQLPLHSRCSSQATVPCPAPGRDRLLHGGRHSSGLRQRL